MTALMKNILKNNGIKYKIFRELYMYLTSCCTLAFETRWKHRVLGIFNEESSQNLHKNPQNKYFEKFHSIVKNSQTLKTMKNQSELST